MLGENARLPNVQIAAAIGVSHSTVKKRIDRLVESGVCRILGVVNPEKLGFDTSAFVCITARPGKVTEITQALTLLPEVYWVGEMTGRWEVFAEVVVRGVGDLFDVVAEKIARVPGILTVETLVVMRQTWWRPIQWRPPEEQEGRQSQASRVSQLDRWRLHAQPDDGDVAGRTGAGHAEAPVPERVDEIDLRIIGLLQEHGRCSASVIARAIGVSQATVQNRIRRLLASGVFKVVGVVNPGMLGFKVDALVYIRTDPEKTVDVGESVSRFPEVFWLAYATGQFEIVVQTTMQDTEKLLKFVDRSLGSIPGVRSAEVSFIVRQTPWRPAEWRPTRDWVTRCSEWTVMNSSYSREDREVSDGDASHH